MDTESITDGAPAQLKKGCVREDGMVFWARAKSCANGEHWVTPEKYASMCEVIRKRQRDYYAENEDFRERQAAYQRGYRERRRGIIKENNALYYVANRGAYIDYQNEYQRKRRANDPLFALSKQMRRRLHHALCAAGYTKKSRTFDIIGCSVEFLRDRLERQFTEGMSWDNRGEWHVDHIIPLASAKTEEELLALCHYTNLQPLWAKDNLSKGTKILDQPTL